MDQQNWIDLESRFQEASEYNQDLQRFEPKTYEELHNVKPQTISTTCTTTSREYSKDASSLQKLESIFNEAFRQEPSERILKLYTGAGGLEAFNKVFKNKFG